MNKEKVDKGFELIYYKLSYRRRFIRTLWMIPWMILVLCFLYWSGISIYVLVLAAVIFTIIAFKQALYNYKQWKKFSNEEED